jgi:uncharacterized protein (DUF305 family)
MTLTRARSVAALLLAAIVAGCGAARAAAQAAPHAASSAAADSAGIARARADSLRYPYTAADVQFMTHMIGHHAQALVMAGWAPSHGANPEVLRLADRIINAQNDEITIMQQWLRDRRQPVPEAKPGPMKMVMDGMEHEMLMPGMLTDAQMKELDQARGKEFDRLFLRYMIQHHRGAVSMVNELFGTSGAAQDETVFKFANDVQVDQSTEIARMEKMLAFLTLGITAP